MCTKSTSKEQLLTVYDNVKELIEKRTILQEKPEKYNPAVKPLFKTSYERYEYLMKYGCTCNDDRVWLTAYKDSKEYKQYETDIC